MQVIDQQIHYQAVGYLQAKMMDRKGTNIDGSIDNDLFSLRFTPEQKAKVQIGQTYWFRAYPEYCAETKQYSFTSIAVFNEAPPKLQPQSSKVFIFKGMYEAKGVNADGSWQQPVFAIYRNFDRLTPQQRIEYIQANNLCTKIPFEIPNRRPYIVREGKDHKLFYQILVRFVPQTNQFYYLRAITEPTPKRPRKLKVTDLDESKKLAFPQAV